MMDTIFEPQVIKLEGERGVFVNSWHGGGTWIALSFPGDSAGCRLTPEQTKELIEMLGNALEASHG